MELGYAQYMLAGFTEALDNLNTALSLNPRNENAHHYGGLVYIKQYNKSMAQKMVHELKTLDSKLAPGLQTKVEAMSN